MAAWLPNRHATVARPRTVGPSSISTKTRRPPSLEPEVGANPSGRGRSMRSSARRSSHTPRAPTAPIIAISAPARSTPRRNSRPRSAVVTMSGSCRVIMLLISHLPRRVAPPPRTSWHILSLHQEGVGGQHRPITHRHVVVDEGADSDRAAGAKRRSAGLVGAVLLRIALDNALLIEHALVPDDGQSRLGNEDAIVEHPLAEPNANQTPEHALEWRAVEEVQEAARMQLPNALDPPEPGVVDGTDGRRRGTERFEAPLHQGVVDRGDDRAQREERRHDRMGKHAVEKLEGGQVDEHDQEDPQPPCGQENADRPKVEPVLCGQAAAQRFPRPEMVESAVALDGPRNLEGWRAQQAHPFANLAVDRDHHLGPEEAVVARPAPRRVGDVVA